MYLPVMRGKQWELTALKELAPVISCQYFKPIIDPVRKDLSQLIKTIKSLNNHSNIPIVIVNPYLDEFENNDKLIYNDLKNNDLDLDINFIPCVIVHSSIKHNKIINDLTLNHSTKAVYIHDDIHYNDIQFLSNFDYVIIKKNTPNYIIEKLNNIVLVEDSFKKKKRNADYEDESFFSDLAFLTSNIYSNVLGFGDFTIVGEEYSKTGGPPHVVTIHLSYIAAVNEKIYVKHFSSEADNSINNPAGKFMQALEKTIQTLNSYQNPFLESSGIQELRDLYITRHYPGLGVLKKISMKHHIETISEYINRNEYQNCIKYF